MKKNLLAFVVVFVLVLVGVMVCLSFFSGRVVHTKTTVTLNIIQAILSDFDALENTKIQMPLLSSIDQEDSLSINKIIASNLKGQKSNLQAIEPYISPDGVLRDAWGTPLVFIGRHSTNYARINNQVYHKSRPFIIWSAGVNCSNEFGFGDDIFTGR